MNLQEFNKAVLDAVNLRLPNSRLARLKQVKKANGISYTGMYLESGSKPAVSPIIYLEPVFAKFKEGAASSIDAVADELAMILMQPLKQEGDIFRIPDREYASGRIVFRLMSCEKNRDLLESLPHRRFLDLAVTYGILISGGSGMGIAKVTDEIAEKWDLSEKDLYALARENTPRLLPTVCRRFFPDGAENRPESRFYMCTNEASFFGSAELLFLESIRNIAKTAGEDLYILPVTVHDLILVTAGTIGETEARQLLKLMQDAEPQQEDVLSDEIYRYSLREDRVEVCLPAIG